MVLFLVLWGISRVVVLAVVVLQFLCVLIRSETNAQLTVFGQSLATYTCGWRIRKNPRQRSIFTSRHLESSGTPHRSQASDGRLTPCPALS